VRPDLHAGKPQGCCAGPSPEMCFTEVYWACRTANIADGSNEILKRTIVKHLLEGDDEI